VGKQLKIRQISLKLYDKELTPAEQAIELYQQGAFKNQAERMLKMFQHVKSSGDSFIPTSLLSQNFKQYNARILELRAGKHDGIKRVITSARIDGEFGFKYEGRY